MPLNPDLLRAARETATRVKTAEADLEAAREHHRAAVRTLHGSGARLREIAAALDLSHQRVHQLVAPRETADAPPPAEACSLCGEAAAQGPICPSCREAALRLIGGEALDGARGLRVAYRHNRRPCSLCGRLPAAGERFAEGREAAVCGDCLGPS